MRAVLPLVALLALAGPAAAGSRDAPEVPDPDGDCAFPAGNEYADIVAAWISDETAADFRVHIALAKWTNEALGSYAGYTLQFTHQDVQWGVAAYHDLQAGWQWRTAYIDTDEGDFSDLNETTGEWDASTSTMSIVFPKSLFPHSGDDDRLAGFVGGTADFKKDMPVFIAQSAGAPVPPVGGLMACDLIESSATYTFTVGQHTQHGGAPADAALEANATLAAAEEPMPTASRAPPGGSDTRAPSWALVLAVLACLAAARSGSRRP